MENPHVILLGPHGDATTLHPGDIIGRGFGAALRIDDPRISEAHAMVSLRGPDLLLLALRGGLQVDGQGLTSVPLAPGLRVRLARDLELTVVALRLPPEVLALAFGDAPPTVLVGPAVSVAGTPPRLQPRLVPTALAVAWTDGRGWRIAVGEELPEPLIAGATWTLEGVTLRALAVARESAGLLPTCAEGRGEPPLHLLLRHDAVHIHRPDQPSLSLNGRVARILCELHALGGIADWKVAASQIWGPDKTDSELRTSWDKTVHQLRHRLRKAGVRTNLVRATHTGAFELLLLPTDQVTDEL